MGAVADRTPIRRVAGGRGRRWRGAGADQLWQFYLLFFVAGFGGRCSRR